MSNTASCELCMQPGGAVLWQDRRCRVVLVDDPAYRGFCRVIWNAHVKEMTDLSANDRRHCMCIVFAVECVLRKLLRPEKINLASLGNMTPHVHWHVIPRFLNDAHFPQPVWSRRRRAAPEHGAAPAIGRLRRSLAAEIARTV